MLCQKVSLVLPADNRNQKIPGASLAFIPFRFLPLSVSQQGEWDQQRDARRFGYRTEGRAVVHSALNVLSPKVIWFAKSSDWSVGAA